MSSSTVASAAATATSVCTSNLYDIPVDDIACAMPYGKNHTDIMANCCGDADVVSYYNDCGIYCLALGQSADDLTECFYENGASHGVEVFCNAKNNTQSATGTGQADIPKTASASVVHAASATSSKSSSSDDDDDDSSDSNDSDSKNSTSSDDDDSAAFSVKPQPAVTTLGLAIGALLFSATTFGAFQL